MGDHSNHQQWYVEQFKVLSQEISRLRKLLALDHMPEPASPVVDTWGMYTTPDEEAPETEVMDLLEAFVRVLKPKVVVETGTALGHTAERIARALQDMERGHLYTIEIAHDKAEHCRRRLEGLPATVIQAPCLSVNAHQFGEIDLLFIDAVLEDRAREYRHFGEALRYPTGVAILHDTLKFDPPKSQVEALPDNKIWLYTPRGVTICQPWRD